MDRNNTPTLPPMNETTAVPPLHESQTSPSGPGGRSAPVHVLISSAPSNLFYGTETQIASPHGELEYSVPNARPPGTVDNDNRAYEPDPIYSLKYADPPSYEEAIKAMHYKPPEEQDHRLTLNPDQGQFSTSEPYFYHQTYNNELETELAKSFCSRIIFAIIIFGFAACAVRVLCYLT